MTPPAGRDLDAIVVRADSADLDTLSQVIAEAFHDLAPSRWLIGDPAARREIFPGYFRILIEHAMANGVIHTTPDRTAAALWIPVDKDGPAPPPDYDARLPVATRPWTSRFLAFDTALDRHHPVGVPHHHLAILAVSPQRQGQGTGTALLRAYHQMLDHDARMPAYLEAADLRTRQIYLRHGYTDHGPPIQLADGPLIYPMWRECGPTAVTAGGHGKRAGQPVPALPRRIPKGTHGDHPAGYRQHPAPGSGQDVPGKLATELRARGYEARPAVPDGRPSSPAVTSPQATVLAETVIADAASSWWPQADRLAGVAGMADAAARVLAAVPGGGLA